MDLEEELAQLHERILRCRRCHLSETRKNAVPGEGPITAQVMFVGEAPGRMEDLEGRPFVGRAGRLLDQLLVEAGLERERIFIGNVVKCRPISPEGRDRRPTPEEISTCSPYLDRQIELIKPRILCPMGGTATSYLLEKYGFTPQGISKIHGKLYKVKEGILYILPLYHPAAALYLNRLKDVLRKDFQRLKDLMSQSTLEAFN